MKLLAYVLIGVAAAAVGIASTSHMTCVDGKITFYADSQPIFPKGWYGAFAMDREEIELAAANGYNMVELAFMWADMEITEGNYHFAYLDNLLDYCAERNIKVLLRLVDRTPPEWLSRKFPEVYAMSPDGKSINGVTNESIFIFNHPGYVAAAKRWYTATARHVKDHPAVFAYQIGFGEMTETQLHQTIWTDYSGFTRNQFNQWLSNRYKTTSAISEAWGYSVPDFKSIGLPRPLGQLQANQIIDTRMNWRDWLIYRGEIMRIYPITEFSKALKEGDPHHLVYAFSSHFMEGFAETARAGLYMTERILDDPNIDFVRVLTDTSGHSGCWSIGGREGFLPSILEMCNRHGKGVIFEVMSASHGAPPVDEVCKGLRYHSAMAIMSGSGFIGYLANYFRPYGDVAFKEYRKWSDLIMEPQYSGKMKKLRAARLLQSWPLALADRAFDDRPWPDEHPYYHDYSKPVPYSPAEALLGEIEGFSTVLADAGLSADAIREKEIVEGKLSNYDLLILGNITDFMLPGTLDKIKQFTAAGGKLLVLGATGMKSAGETSVLSELLGTPVQGVDSTRPRGYYFTGNLGFETLGSMDGVVPNQNLRITGLEAGGFQPIAKWPDNTMAAGVKDNIMYFGPSLTLWAALDHPHLPDTHYTRPDDQNKINWMKKSQDVFRKIYQHFNIAAPVKTPGYFTQVFLSDRYLLLWQRRGTLSGTFEIDMGACGISSTTKLYDVFKGQRLTTQVVGGKMAFNYSLGERDPLLIYMKRSGDPMDVESWMTRIRNWQDPPFLLPGVSPFANENNDQQDYLPEDVKIFSTASRLTKNKWIPSDNKILRMEKTGSDGFKITKIAEGKVWLENTWLPRNLRCSFRSSDYPFLTFDYKIEEGATMNLFLSITQWGVSKYSISDTTGGAFGKLNNVSYGTWQHAEINLDELLKDYFGNYVIGVDSILFGDYEGTGQVGKSFYIDNIKLISTAHTVSGTVKNSNTGQPVADAIVRCGSSTSYTDAAGRYQIQVLPGSSEMIFGRLNYQILVKPVDINSDTVINVSLIPATTVYRLYPYQTAIEGRWGPGWGTKNEYIPGIAQVSEENGKLNFTVTSQGGASWAAMIKTLDKPFTVSQVNLIRLVGEKQGDFMGYFVALWDKHGTQYRLNSSTWNAFTGQALLSLITLPQDAEIRKIGVAMATESSATLSINTFEVMPR